MKEWDGVGQHHLHWSAQSTLVQHRRKQMQSPHTSASISFTSLSLRQDLLEIKSRESLESRDVTDVIAFSRKPKITKSIFFKT